jgi:hypothetical protein
VARVVYSALLTQATSVPDVGTSLGGPPAGYLWVVRFAAATFGSFLAYSQLALALQDGNPWLWVCSSPLGFSLSNHAVTWFWEGRLVVPAGGVLWAKSSAGDACDVSIHGYELVVD